MKVAIAWDVTSAECHSGSLDGRVNFEPLGYWRWTVEVPEVTAIGASSISGVVETYAQAMTTAGLVIDALNAAIDAMATPCVECHAAIVPPSPTGRCRKCLHVESPA